MTSAAADQVVPERTEAHPDAVLHWYDFVCPYCYLSQPDNDELIERDWRVIELGFRAHPEIPDEGIHIGPRVGAMYASIESAAAQRRLPLYWPDKLPNTRLALGAAEWIRRNAPQRAERFRKATFAAHFADRQDIGDVDTVLAIAVRCAVPAKELAAAIARGEPDRLLGASRDLAIRNGVSGTPAWLYSGQLIVGLQRDGLVDRLSFTGEAPSASRGG